jgi:hypothetical protein
VDGRRAAVEHDNRASCGVRSAQPITHAEVFAGSRDKRRLLEAIGARRIGRVTVHDVRSRTLSELGPPQTMIVYELPQG